MKSSVAVNLLSQMFLAQFSEEEHEALGMAIDALNTLAARPEIIMCKDCKYLQEVRSEESARKFGQISSCGAKMKGE